MPPILHRRVGFGSGSGGVLDGRVTKTCECLRQGRKRITGFTRGSQFICLQSSCNIGNASIRSTARDARARKYQEEIAMKDPPAHLRRLVSSRRSSAMRVAAALILPMLAGCAKSAPPPAPPEASAPVDEQKLCADEHWREQYPGLSFDVCHRNAMKAD
jgi:hypothetical protein